MACTADIVPQLETQPNVLEFDPPAADAWSITMETPGWPGHAGLAASLARTHLQMHAYAADGYGYLDNGTLTAPASWLTHDAYGVCCGNCEKGMPCGGAHELAPSSIGNSDLLRVLEWMHGAINDQRSPWEGPTDQWEFQHWELPASVTGNGGGQGPQSSTTRDDVQYCIDLCWNSPAMQQLFAGRDAICRAAEMAANKEQKAALELACASATIFCVSAMASCVWACLAEIEWRRLPEHGRRAREWVFGQPAPDPVPPPPPQPPWDSNKLFCPGHGFLSVYSVPGMQCAATAENTTEAAIKAAIDDCRKKIEANVANWAKENIKCQRACLIDNVWRDCYAYYMATVRCTTNPSRHNSCWIALVEYWCSCTPLTGMGIVDVGKLASQEVR